MNNIESLEEKWLKIKEFMENGETPTAHSLVEDIISDLEQLREEGYIEDYFEPYRADFNKYTNCTCKGERIHFITVFPTCFILRTENNRYKYDVESESGVNEEGVSADNLICSIQQYKEINISKY